MIIFFEIIKIVFFLLSILLSVFFLRGYYILGDNIFTLLGTILMPLYLVITGLILGYAGLMFHKTKIRAPLTPFHRNRGFMGGLLVGIIFAVLYTFLA